ncbi:MAG: hypothetical protein AAB393_01135, partial [Bacteroidota bacterium]
KFDRSVIYSPDAQALLAGISLPDLQQLGRAKLVLTFVGKPLDFQTQLSLETEAGNVQTNGTLKIGGVNGLQYKGETQFTGINLATLTNNDDLDTRLNGSLQIDGRGVSLNDLNTTLDVRLDSSLFAGRPVNRTQLRVNAEERSLTANGQINVGTMGAQLSATLDRRQKDSPLFSVVGTVSSLNLEEILQESSSNSDLSFAIDAHGTGLTWGTLNGEFLLNFSPSRYREYRIDSSTVLLAFDQRNPQRKQLRLSSNIADFSLIGAFDTEYMKDLIAYELLNLRKAVSEKFVSLDSTFGTNVDPTELAALEKKLAAPREHLNTDFSLHVKDLEPVSVATSDRTFNGIGVLTGTVRGNFHNLSITAKLNVDDFFYGSADSGILIHDGTATLDVNNLKPHAPLKEIGFRLLADAGNMHINRSEFDSLRVTFKYEQEYSSYTASGQYNRDTRVIIKGFSNIAEDYLVFTLNDFQVGFRDFMWQADGGASVGFGSRGIRITNLTMRRDSQVVSVSGSIARGKAITGAIAANNINLEDLKYLLGKEELDARREAFTGTASLSVNASGTLEDVTYAASLTANRVTFRGVPLGNLDGRLSYSNQTLSTNVEVTSRASKRGDRPDLLVTGTLPINLDLSSAKEETHRERPMNLTIRSEGIQIGILDPILPTFNQLSGIMKCNVKVAGLPSDPDYSGTLTIDSSAFLFVPNYISYTFAGQFQFQGDRIKVKDAVVQSRPLDDQFRRQGLIRFTGDFALRDFKPGDFNLTAKGGLLVVRETTRKSSLSVFGNLFVETGSNGLHYTGEVEQSLLKGYVLVQNSSLIFPPTQQVVNEELSNTVPVRDVDDTTKVTVQQARPLAERYFGV